MATASGRENESASIPKFWIEALKLVAAKLNYIQERYREFVANNIESASRLESVLKFLSYIVPGRFGASEALAELLFSASQLLALLHDWIYREEKGIKDFSPASCEEQTRMTLWLTVIETVEVFIEVGADRIWGEIGKWIVIVIVQIAKVALRYLLLFKYKSGIQLTPLIPSLDREFCLHETKKDWADGKSCESVSNKEEVLWHGKRTNRSVRSLTSVSADGLRTWKLPAEKEIQTGSERSQSPSRLSAKRLIGESLYISRPLIHVIGMFMFGQKSWTPWLLACGTELSSLCLMGDPSDLNKSEKAELSRRTILLAFYMLRSPFYDTYSKKRVISFLKYLNITVPGCSLIIGPLVEYLPVWQKTYFYNWAN